MPDRGRSPVWEARRELRMKVPRLRIPERHDHRFAQAQPEAGDRLELAERGHKCAGRREEVPGHDAHIVCVGAHQIRREARDKMTQEQITTSGKEKRRRRAALAYLRPDREAWVR